MAVFGTVSIIFLGAEILSFRGHVASRIVWRAKERARKRPGREEQSGAGMRPGTGRRSGAGKRSGARKLAGKETGAREK